MNDELDAHLKKLALEAQNHPQKSFSQRIALAKLMSEIQKSGKLYYPRPPRSQQFWELYAEARQELFLYIGDRIEKYDPQKGEVLQWVNFRLKMIVKSLFRKTSQPPPPIDPPALQECSLVRELRQYINEDPEGLFRATYIGKNPQANFRFLAQRILDGYKWREIAAELDIPMTTLSSFYQRRLTKFLPKFKAYFSDKPNINQENKNECDR